MGNILHDEERVIEEDLFGFSLSDAMFIDALSAIPLIPLKTLNLGKI